MDYSDFVFRVFSCLNRGCQAENDIGTVLDVIREYADLSFAALIITPPSRALSPQIIGAESDLDVIRAHGADLLALRGHGELLTKTPKVIDLEDEKFCDEQFRNLFLHKIKVVQVLCLDFEIGETQFRLRFGKAARQSYFTSEQCAEITKICPFIRDYFQRVRTTAVNTSVKIISEKLLKSSQIGIALINIHGEIFYMSDLMEELLERSSTFLCNNNRLISHSKEGQLKLQCMISETNTSNPISIASLSCKNNQKFTFAVCYGPPPESTIPVDDEYYTCLIFSPKTDYVGISALASLWRISPAEQRLLNAVMEFSSIKRVAKELGISPNTAKVQLKSVYRKIGVDSKPLLVKWLSAANNFEALLC